MTSLPRTARPVWRLVAAVGLAFVLVGCASVPSGPTAGTPAPVANDAHRARGGLAPVLPQGSLSAIGTADAPAVPVASLAAPADLWERIRRGFAMEDLDNDLVRDHERWYASRPDYIQRMTERSSRYLFHIVEEIERRNIPMELALLPFIESAFNPQAVSSARAAGMWQFMPATGASFDLKQNAFRDDRRDVLASTRAALDYLQQLHARFGDWHLALAAYNWGQGNVNRAITRNQRAGLPTRYTDLTMPAETRNYVPKLQAVKNIIARPASFNTALPAIGNHPFFDTVTLTRDMDVALIARLAGVAESDFRQLNPQHKQPVVMAAASPQVLLPWDNAVIFQRNLAAHEGPLATWTAWVVPSTMTVAQAAQRVGMSERELREVNNIPPRMQVKAGSSLLVHRSQARDRDVPGHVADNAMLALQPERVLRRTVVKARQGDTVARLARRYGVSAAQVAEWNPVSASASLKAGQSITLMLPQRPAASGGTRTASAKKGTPRPRATAQASKRPAARTSTAQRKAAESRTRVAAKKP